MTYNNCFSSNDIKYCSLSNGNLIIGDNSTSSKNAVASEISITCLEIPETANQKSIEEIGQYAFSYLTSLTSVSIKARIKQINRYAFYCCSNISYINIPSSTLFIGYVAISFKTPSDVTQTGTVRVIFDYPASVKYICSYAIERKENMIIYFFGKKKPVFEGGIFAGATNKTVFALAKMKFDTVKTTQYGMNQITNVNHYRIISNHILIISMILS